MSSIHEQYIAVCKQRAQYIERLYVHSKYNISIHCHCIKTFWNILMQWQYTVIWFIYWTLFSIYWTSTCIQSIYCECLIITVNNIEQVQRALPSFIAASEPQMCFVKPAIYLSWNEHKTLQNMKRNMCVKDFEVKLLTSRWHVKWFRSQHKSVSWRSTFETGQFSFIFSEQFLKWNF